MPRRSNFAKKDHDDSAYYTIDNTEDIYGTKLSPAQRCYVDPWDLENYDYVRRKIDYTPSPTSVYNTTTKQSSRKSMYAPAPSNFDQIQPIYNDNYGYLRYSPELYDDNFYGTNNFYALNDEPMHHGYEEFSTSSNESSMENDIAMEYPYTFSPYECCNCYSIYESCGLKKSSAASIYGGSIYTNKFGLSKKGLLQIDYSYNWDDLDRAIGASYYYKAN